jgi:putative CocE/NonD family hydrolase
MGPWGHGLNTRTLGQLDFGPQAVIDLESLERRWLDRWVRDEENGVEHEAPVRLFIMGTNVWREEWEWPLSRARETAWYLASGGRANSLFGDGTLSDTPVDGVETDGYLYNPENPVPALDGGPQDHAPIERRDDVLVFTGPELREPLEVTGDITAVLYATSDAPDTDFVVRLCDVHPDGRSINICDGIMRARYREGLDQEVLMTPGTIYEFEITMGVTANTFLPGHRLRLEITSSCFPRFNRNLNTGEPIATGTNMQHARQTIYHSRAYPSRVLLPVVSSEGVR